MFKLYFIKKKMLSLTIPKKINIIINEDYITIEGPLGIKKKKEKLQFDDSNDDVDTDWEN